MPTAAQYPPFDPLAYARQLKAANVPEAQAEAQAEALRAALLVSEARQQAAIEHAAQLAREQGAKAEAALRELDAKAQQSSHDLDIKAGRGILELKADIAKNERAILELKAEIAKTQADIAKIQQTILEVRADIVKTQQAIHELKAHVDVRHAQIQGQFRLHNWMLTALLGLAIAIALKLFL